MTAVIKIAKLVLRHDGKYDCDVSVEGYWEREYAKEVKNGTEYVTGVKKEEYHKFTKGQKIVMKLDEQDVGTDLCNLMSSIRMFIGQNPALIEQLKEFEHVSLQVDETEQSPEAQQAACDSEQCSFPECDHVCGYNPDKDDRPISPAPSYPCPKCGSKMEYVFGEYLCTGCGYTC